MDNILKRVICSNFWFFALFNLAVSLRCMCMCMDNNNTYIFLNNKTKDQTKEHKLCLSKDKLNLADNMQDLLSLSFILASPVCSIKPLLKDITSIFKLFYENVERYHTKGKHGEESRPSGLSTIATQ